MAVKIIYKEVEDPHKYGIPELKKYPMPDKKHVISAIKFFNYVTPKYEEQLAKAILARMKEYGISFEDVGIGDDNRFKKYISESGELIHHGIQGQKWGIRRYQNKDGSLTPAGRRHAAKTYNYRESEAYKTSDRYKKASMTNLYNNEKKLFGQKNANKLEYKVNEEGQDRSSLVKKEFTKRAFQATAVSALIAASPYLISAGEVWYDKQKARIELNNMAVNLYGEMNNIPMKSDVGIGLGIKEAKRGKEIAERILGHN